MADLQKKSRMGSMRVAFGGIIAAVDLVLLFLTGLFPMGTLALPALAGVLLLAVRIEVSAPWAAITYGMVAVLSFFLSPDKQAYALFTVFFGYYPVLKYTLERLHHKAVSWGLKFVVFNAALVLYGWICLFLLQIDIAPIQNSLYWSVPLVLIFGNMVFWVYDRALSGLAFLYWQRLHPAINRLMREK